jgi:hypothetical protein
MRKCLRVRFYDDEKHVEVASSVQLVLPDGMGVSEARDYLVWKLNREIGNYVADECARHFFD